MRGKSKASSPPSTFASRRSALLFRGPDISLLHGEQSPCQEVKVLRGRERNQFILIYRSPVANSKTIIPGQRLCGCD